MVHLLVKIQRTPEGGLDTSHNYAAQEDQAEASSWPSGGLTQIAHAMFIEALRREAYTMAIAMLSSGTKPEDLTAGAIEELTRAHSSRMLDKFAGSAAAEAYARIIPS